MLRRYPKRNYVIHLTLRLYKVQAQKGLCYILSFNKVTSTDSSMKRNSETTYKMKPANLKYQFEWAVSHQYVYVKSKQSILLKTFLYLRPTLPLERALLIRAWCCCSLNGSKYLWMCPNRGTICPDNWHQKFWAWLEIGIKSYAITNIGTLL